MKKKKRKKKHKKQKREKEKNKGKSDNDDDEEGENGTSNHGDGGAQENVDGENGKKKEQRDDEYGTSNLDEGEGDEGENDTRQYADDVRNLLLQGAENQCTDDVKRAIESGVDINCVNTMEESALIITIKQNSICSEERNCADNMILDMLLSSGANVNVEDIHANSPIILAMDKGCVHQVKKLIHAGADVNAKIIGTSVL